MKKILLFGLAMIFILLAGCKTENKWEVKSPDNELKFSLELDSSGSLFYTVSTLNDGTWEQVMDLSPLGIRRTDTDFTEGLEFIESGGEKNIDEDYNMVIGTTSTQHDHATGNSFDFRNKDGNNLVIECRAYNEGAAFRYIFPEQDTGIFEVTGEITGFNLPDTGKAWLQPYDTIAYWAPAYEQFFMNGIEIGTMAPENKNGWCFPMLFEVEEHWIYISEAGLEPDYAGSHLEAEAPGGLYTVRLPEPDEAYNYFKRNPESTLPWNMPWRYILVSRDAGVIVNSNHVYHLSEPSRLEDKEWIHPGIASWSWWSEGRSPRDFNTLKKFVDFSAEMGWRYSLVDAGWHNMQGGDIGKLIEYADSKGVGILLWYDSGGRVGYVTDAQRKIMFDDSTRQAELERISDMGAKGIKVDFFQSDKQGMIGHYYDVLADAAANHLVVNFHGCTLPRGWSRTFPNLLTMEAIIGAEAYRFNRQYTNYGPTHNTIIPFTRNVAGPMDYTPVTFSDSRYPHTTTAAHELALGVIFHSGIQHFADNYKAYESLPELALEYLKKVPATWDESRLIRGYPGKDVVLLRRKANRWFIAGINGEKKKKPVEINTDFLGEGDWEFKIISDGLDRDELDTITLKINAGEPYSVIMSDNGGFVGFFEKRSE